MLIEECLQGAGMKKRLFTDEDTTPTEALLRKELGSAMDYYAGILAKSGNYRKQWQYLSLIHI